MTAVVCAGCSLQSELPLDDRPCSSDQTCLAGYTCVGSSCVKANAVPLAGACIESSQCPANAVCMMPGIHQGVACRTLCSTPYTQSSCSAGTFCMPGTDENSNTVYACIPTTCDSNFISDQGDVRSGCIPVSSSPNIKLALIPCRIVCDGLTCGHDCDEGSTCQPVGTNETLVCIPTPTNQPLIANGGVCDHHSQPCQVGHVCKTHGLSSGYCRPMCQAGVSNLCNNSTAACSTAFPSANGGTSNGGVCN